MGVVSEFMNADHAYLDHLWSDFLSKGTEVTRAIELFGYFSDHLTRHIELENNYLFPRFDSFLAIEPDFGPTAIARRDHENIIKLLGMVDIAGQSNNLNKVLSAGLNLRRALESHLEREREIQYAVCDHCFSDEEWNDNVRKIYDEAMVDYILKNFKTD